MNKINKISVSVDSEYLENESQPENQRYVHAYHVTIKNEGLISAQLLSRKWTIVDSNDDTQDIQGDGVIGKQPTLAPGESYRYTSGTIIATETGFMHGCYEMQSEDGSLFQADIPAFTLATPGSLN